MSLWRKACVDLSCSAESLRFSERFPKGEDEKCRSVRGRGNLSLSLAFAGINSVRVSMEGVLFWYFSFNPTSARSAHHFEYLKGGYGGGGQGVRRGAIIVRHFGDGSGNGRLRRHGGGG